MKVKKKKRYLKERDNLLIDFISTHHLLMTSKQASDLIYKNIRVAQRRLFVLFETENLNRCREYVGEPYIYYKGKLPTRSSIPHKLLITEFIVKLCERFKVKEIYTEFNELESPYKIRPDIYAVISFEGYCFGLLIECDLTNKFSKKMNDYIKIDIDRMKGNLKDILKYPTFIVSCSDDKPPQTNQLPLIWVDTELVAFKNIESRLIQLLDAHRIKSSSKNKKHS